MKRIVFTNILMFFIVAAVFGGDEPVSPLRIDSPKMPALRAKIEIPEKIDVTKELKPGAVGEENEHWGERKSVYFGGLEIDETNGLQYVEPLKKEETEGKEYYEHIYCGETLTEIDYRDEKGNLKTDDKNEAAVIKQRYDKEGNLIEESSYNPDGTLKSDWYGYAIYRWEYDSKRTRIKGAFYDKDGKLTKKMLCDTAINTWTYDDKGNMVIWANYDPNGKLAKDILGIAATKYEYDGSKRETLAATYGTDRQLTNNKYGFAVSLQMYDDEKRTQLVARYDKDLKPVEIEGGCFVLLTIDAKGKWSESAFYDAEGKLRENPDGAAIIMNLNDEKNKSQYRRIYNKEKNLISEWELDEKAGKWRQVNTEENQ